MTTQKHHIQIHILTKLLSRSGSQGLRYRDIKPYKIENDLYNYHLQYLAKENLIYKKDDLYFLSDTGKQFIEDVSPLDPAGIQYNLFRANVLACCLKKEKNKVFILNQTRLCQPFQGDTGIIGGAVHKGELIEEAAARKFKEETGLEGTFTPVGIIRKIRYTEDGNIFSDITFHVCVSNDCKGKLVEENEFGKNFWCDVKESVKYESSSKQGSKNLAQYLGKLKIPDYKSSPFFYFQEKKTLKSF